MLVEEHRQLRINEKKVIFLSMSALTLEEQILHWREDVMTASSRQTFLYLYRKLTEFQTTIERMYQETNRQLESPGMLNPDKLHLVYDTCKEKAIKRLYDSIRIEMYRLVLLGRGEYINRLNPHLTYVHNEPKDLYDYYEMIATEIKSIADVKKKAVWAYQYHAKGKMIGPASLTFFSRIQPKKGRTDTLFGEYTQLSSATTIQWQGIGAFSNVTPQNIDKAQQHGIHTIIDFDLADTCSSNLLGDPRSILESCFADSYYAIEPEVYFSHASLSMMRMTVIQRVQSKQCIYCGNPTEGGRLCVRCINRLQQNMA